MTNGFRCKICHHRIEFNERFQRWFHEPFEMWFLRHVPEPDAIPIAWDDRPMDMVMR